jgi:hypothetical protein
MLRRLLTAIFIPPLLVAVTVLVIIGLRDLELLVAIVSRLIVVTTIIGIPMIVLKMIVLPKKKQNGKG